MKQMRRLIHLITGWIFRQSNMKTLKQHIKDKEYEDFEEDLIGDKKPSENKNEKSEDKKENEEKK